MPRRAITITGTVQGVGFRPFVFGLAGQFNLHGFVRNTAGSVCIEVEGPENALASFVAELQAKPPGMSRIDELNWVTIPPRGESSFRIEQSVAGSGVINISPDLATCDECLRELFDPADRRYRYPFLNCTNCGPRLTIITGSPYDREQTTMAGFAMCPACRGEYQDPTNRRFHAQPTACPICGPRLFAFDSTGAPVPVAEPLDWFIENIRAGRIGAMKGLGGYHLVCDACNAGAVGELRRRKHRDEKPFAVMVEDVAAAEQLCSISQKERELLCCPQRPIVLLLKRDGVSPSPGTPGEGQGEGDFERNTSVDIRKHPHPNPLPAYRERGPVSAPGATLMAEAVAPNHPYLGVMLPYTPLHHLLMRGMNGTPLVMTSGNRSDEPIAITEPAVFERLAGIADCFLTHDRPIHVRCDDSVTRMIGDHESPIRRSRGYAPRPVRLPVDCSQAILAVGGQLKATFALGNDRHAIVGHHLGDLDHFEAFRAFEKDVALYERLFQAAPKIIAHDLHPDYASTQYAVRRAAAEGLLLIPVQHHHAHMASCMAEHGLNEPVIGVTFDGTGYGTDGAVWGGEFLIGDFCSFRRAARLRYVGMPGGDRAIREPWRMAVAHLRDAGCDYDVLNGRVSSVAMKTVEQMLLRQFNTQMTSSAGRLFDAVASILGVRDTVNYEGQAAIQLEWLASKSTSTGNYPFDEDVAPTEIDTRPLIQSIHADVLRGINPADIARQFHNTVVEIISSVCQKIRNLTNVNSVVFSGGVFMNALLSTEADRRLTADGFRVYQHRLVPPNDGGLSLGQLAIAASRLAVQGV